MGRSVFVLGTSLLAAAMLSACGGGSVEENRYAVPGPGPTTSVQVEVAGTPVSFEPLASGIYSNVWTAKNVVVENHAAWEALWKEAHAYRMVTPPLPWVDFSQRIVVGVFSGGRPDGCRGNEIILASVAGDTLRVEYTPRVEYSDHGANPGPMAVCPPSLTTPFSLAVINRVAAKVDFKRIEPRRMDFSRVAMPLRLDVAVPPYTAVVKDEAALRALWSTHVTAGTPVPSVDFAQSMLVFAYGGITWSGCESTTFTGYAEVGGQLYAQLRRTGPGPTVSCIPETVATGELIQVPRGDAPVVIADRLELFPYPLGLLTN